MNIRIPNVRAQGTWLRKVVLFAFWAATACAVGLAAWSGYHVVAGMAETELVWLFYCSLAAVAAAVGYTLRSRLKVVARLAATAAVGTMAFPVYFLRENFWPVVFASGGAGFLYGLYQILQNQTAPWLLYLTGISAAALAAGSVVHLLRFRWATIACSIVGAMLIACGLLLLSCESEQVSHYNNAMQAREEENPQQQQKALEASQAAYGRRLQSNQLVKTFMPEPQRYLSARAFFHESNVLVTMPNKGKQAYDALTRSLTLNPGNRTAGLTADEAVRDEVDARQAQRNLVKLIRSGQAGSAGTPHGKQGQGEPQQPGDKRDPGREPQPGAGRMPRNTL